VLGAHPEGVAPCPEPQVAAPHHAADLIRTGRREAGAANRATVVVEIDHTHENAPGAAAGVRDGSRDDRAGLLIAQAVRAHRWVAGSVSGDGRTCGGGVVRYRERKGEGTTRRGNRRTRNGATAIAGSEDGDRAA